MRNYVIKPGIRGMFSVNIEDKDFDVVEPLRSHIDWVYAVPEDGVINIPGSESLNVNKDDIVIVFYSSPYSKNVAIVVDNKQWKENIYAETEYESSQNICNNCDECESCLKSS